MKTITASQKPDTLPRHRQKPHSQRIKAAEDGLPSRHETAEQLRRTLDHMIEGCQIISRDFRYVYVNRAVTRQAHKAKHELLGRTMMEAFPGIDRTEMFGHLKRCMAHRQVQSLENEFRFPDGSKGWFELRMEPVPEGVLIFSEDVSQRKRAEEDLRLRNRKLEALTKQQNRTSQALLKALGDLRKAKDEIDLEKTTDQAILENIGEGLIATDAHANIIVINKAAETLLGQPAAELLGKSITRLPLLDEEGRRIPPTKRPIYPVLHGTTTIGPYFTGYYLTREDKGKFPIGLSVTPIWLDGEIIGAIEVFRDISREQETDRAKTEFVSIASHQLRTPLGLAKWYLEAIREEGLDEMSTTARSYLDEIYKSNERVLKVVRELLSVSRIDQAKVKDDPKRVDVACLIDDIVEELNPAATGKHVGLRFTKPEKSPPKLHIDSLRLHEVVQNLIVNAIEYTLRGGSVTVKLGEKEQMLTISVKDTGMGISPADLERLFTKFFRSKEAASRNPDGSGLGLYVVKSYVEGWGGRISVRSQEGHGSTFTITLPLKGVRHDAENTDH